MSIAPFGHLIDMFHRSLTFVASLADEVPIDEPADLSSQTPGQ